MFDRLLQSLKRFHPEWWPFIWAHAMTGFVLAVNAEAFRSDPQTWVNGAIGCALWAACLGGAGAALAAVFGASPSSDPREAQTARPGESVGAGAAIVLVIGLILAPAVHWRFFDAYVIGLILVIIHAAPPVRLGRFQVSGFLAQALGFGALTVFAGYASAGAGGLPDAQHWLYLTGFALLFVAMRVLLWGDRARMVSILFACCLLGAFACLGMAEYWEGEQWHIAALAVPFAVWCVLAFDQYIGEASASGGTSPAAGLFAWLITDAAVAFAALLSA